MNREHKFKLYKGGKHTGYLILHSHNRGIVAGMELSRIHPDGRQEDPLEIIPYDKMMQYTGLKDKNGVEIYEGDKVLLAKSQWPAFQEEQTYAEVYWWDYKCGWYLREFLIPSHPSGYIISELTDYRPDELEVIGNIHDNAQQLVGEGKNE